MRHSRILLYLILAGFFLLQETVFSESKQNDAVYKSEIEKWRADRAARLKSEDGWLSLIGLFWLESGENRFGSGPSNQIVLPKGKGPQVAGSLILEKGAVRLEARSDANISHAGKPVQSLILKTDKSGDPTILNLGSLSFHVIQRGEKLALRIKDRENPARTSFAGIESFSVDPKWRIEAKFEPYNPPKKIPILNIVGLVEDTLSPGVLSFEVAAKNYRLDALAEEGSKELFIIFADQTSGHETYGAGRYLYANAPGPDGKVILDFNKAYNPPCAFTAFATCPLPPRQNRLALRIEAGEKKYSAALH